MPLPVNFFQKYAFSDTLLHVPTKFDLSSLVSVTMPFNISQGGLYSACKNFERHWLFDDVFACINHIFL